MLERYHLGKLSDKERACIEKELSADKELLARYEYIKKSDEKIRQLYPLENLPRLNSIRNNTVPYMAFNRKRMRKPLIIGLGAAAALIIVLFSAIYFFKGRSVDNANEPVIAQENEIDDSVDVIIPEPVENIVLSPVTEQKAEPMKETAQEAPVVAAAPNQTDSGVRLRGAEGDNSSSGLSSNNQQNAVVIPNGVTAIRDNEYSSRQLTGITIPNSVTSIGNEAFANNRLTNITLPRGLTTIGIGAFRSNSLTHVTIPDSVTFIDSGAFYSNQLISVTIGANVEVNDAFPGDFARVYNNGGRTAGTYTRADTFDDWVKK
jgi:hypothetical protein